MNKHRRLYYELDGPEISDSAYDKLNKELDSLEKNFPEFALSDSPTQRVGGAPLKKFEKVIHEVPMLSLMDAFDEGDIKNWFTRLEKYAHKSIGPEFYCELKIDGLSVELIYDSGVLIEASTRGNGKVGENITENVKTINAVPLELKKGNYPKRLIVRGEIFMNKNEFSRINKELEKEGRAIYANPRNIAAGTLRQLDSKLVSLRKLDFFAYDIVTEMNFERHEDEHEVLKKWGFKINTHNKRTNALLGVTKMQQYWDNHRLKLPYEIDGLVVIINNNQVFDSLGVLGKAPRGAVAYKFTPEEATTRVQDIKIQVGRTGVLTPVAVLEPVFVGGVTVSHATLHNFDEIKRLDVKIGDTVIITRSGDVIPKITKVLTDIRTGAEKNIKTPTVCPIDASKIIRDGVYYRCSNKKCGARLILNLKHFVSRNAMNMEGLSGKIIERFLDEGLISDAADLYSIDRSDIAVLSGFGEKSADNIVLEIKNRKKIDLEKFIFALGIQHVGEETSSLLARVITKKATVKKIQTPALISFFENISRHELEDIQDIGPKVADSIENWFNDEWNKKLLKKFDEIGIELLVPKIADEQILFGKTFVLTGTLAGMSRLRAKERIKSLGGHVSNSVSGETDYVVSGDNPGSKHKRAKELGVKILDEKGLLQLLNG